MKLRHRTIGFATASILASALFTAPALARPATEWEIGPIIRGKNYSVGMPLHPTRTGKGWYFDFPGPDARDGHVHYVTFAPGSLAGKSRIVVRYKVEADPGTRFVPQEVPDQPATVSIFLQRGGDNWSAKGRYNYYRWYAPPATVQPLASGVHEITLRFDDRNWVPVSGGVRRLYSSTFREAMTHSSRIGLVFGSAGLRGHGVFATAPARFTLLAFDII